MSVCRGVAENVAHFVKLATQGSAKNTAKAIRSPYFANAFAPAFA